MTETFPRTVRRMVLASFLLLSISLLAFATTLLLPSKELPAKDGGWPVNAYGQTYGAVIDNTFEPIGARDFLLERCPNLIKALAGDTLELGYVYREDFYFDNLCTEEERINLMETGGFSRIIPVYALDGRTIVGSMRLGEAPSE